MKPILATFILLVGIFAFTKAQIIDGYTDKLSYREGETVIFYTKSVANSGTAPYSLRAIDNTIITPAITFALTNQTAMNTIEPWQNGFDYTPTAYWVVPTGFKSGMYFLNAATPIPIIIKNASYPTSADVAIIIPTNTFNAYSDAGGKSLYVNNTGIPNSVTNDHRATIVSFNRPVYAYQQVDFVTGFLKWFNATYANSNVTFIADKDMDDYGEIIGVKVLIVPGHSEYWTREARLNFDQFVDLGHDALVLSGNTMWWQVRLENDPNNSQNPQMICYRGLPWGNGPGDFENDPIASVHPLQVTYHWGEWSLKYSILGSIGSDWMRGGLAVDVGATGQACYNGFNGHRITMPQSPLLNGIWNGNYIAPFLFHDLLPFATGEYDGTLVKTDDHGNVILNNDGDPELNIAALGFYRAEMIGYDKTEVYEDHDANRSNPAINYCPFMVFKKTESSGTVINVNSNEWCSNWVIGHGLTGAINPDGNLNCGTSATLVPDARIPKITQNMIDLMLQDQNQQLNGSNLFSTAAPSSPSFDILPNYTTVSYIACTTGSIDITPTGVTLIDGYKIDNGFTFDNSIVANINNNSFDAYIESTCNNYNNGLRQMQPANSTHAGQFIQEFATDAKTNDKNKKIEEPQDKTGAGVEIIPNPNNGLFEVYLKTPLLVRQLVVYNTLNQEILNVGKVIESKFKIDISSFEKGVYVLKIEYLNHMIDYEKIVVN